MLLQAGSSRMVVGACQGGVRVKGERVGGAGRRRGLNMQPIIQLAVVQLGQAFPGEAHTLVRVAALEFRAALQRHPAPRFSK